MLPYLGLASFVLSLMLVLSGCASSTLAPAPREVRGTWITTTANTAIATPADTARTMQRLREIGLNTVYVEVWKNGYTQHPSKALARTIGVDRHRNLMPQEASELNPSPPRDLTQEMLVEAHRHGLITVAWFEYGFMAAHQSTMTHLRRMKPEWLSRDIKGNEVAPNGFVWMNPLHPEARQFLLDLVLEAIDQYDLDGIQLDDRIVWPYITMGYDDYTKAAYAREHQGNAPPADAREPAWMRWRAEKVNEFARQFVQEVRAKRPGILISLSPAVYPWSWENYLLAWPQWAAWTEKDRLAGVSKEAAAITPRWDEFIPQAYRMSYSAFEKTWREQTAFVRTLGRDRQRDLLAGIRIVGDGNDSDWPQLRDSITLTRTLGNGGHVLWFSRGVLDIFARELSDFYDVRQAGFVESPQFPLGWRKSAVALTRGAGFGEWWRSHIAPGRYRLIGFDGNTWRVIRDVSLVDAGSAAEVRFFVDAPFRQLELILDRREQSALARR